MARHLAAVLVTAGLLTAACGQAPQPPSAPSAPVADAPEDLAAITKAREAFMAAYEKGDADAIGQLYTEEAVSEPNLQPTLAGRDAIVKAMRGMFEQVAIKVALKPEETRTLGSVGLDRGTYVVTVTPKASTAPTTSQGRYLVVYVKGADGTWKASRDMDNAVMVPSQPPTAGAQP